MLLSRAILMVEKTCKKLGIKRIRWVSDEELLLWIKASDIVVYFQKAQSASGIVMKCVVNVVPIVTYDSPSVKDLPILKARDFNEFVNLVLKLLHDREFYNEYVKHLEKLSELYRIDVVARKHEELYLSLVT